MSQPTPSRRAALTAVLCFFVLILTTGCSSPDDESSSAGATDDGETDGGSTTGSGTGSACDQWRTLADGQADIVFETGADDLGMDATDSIVDLYVASSGIGGGGLTLVLRGAFEEVDVNGSDGCITTTMLVFKYAGPEIVVGQELTYAYAGDPTDGDVSAEESQRWYVDINEDKAFAGSVGNTIEYMGTAGTFTWTKINESGEDDHFNQTVEFDISFTKVSAGILDGSAVSSLTGTFTFPTISEI